MTIKVIGSSTTGAVPAAARDDEQAPAARAEAPKTGLKAKAEKVVRGAQDFATSMMSAPVAVATGSAKYGSLWASLHFQGTVTEQVALRDDSELVTGNVDRAASKHLTWTKVTAFGEAGAALMGVGYDRSLTVSAIVPTASHPTAKSVVNLPIDQARVLALNFAPEAIAKYAPGTEFQLSSRKTYTAGVRMQGEASTLGVHEGAEAGGELSYDKSAYTKNVVVRPDDHLHVRIDKSTRLGASLGAGVGVGHGATLDERRNSVGDYRSEAGLSNLVSAHVGLDAESKKTVSIAGNFSTKTDAGKAAYQYLMEANPDHLRANPEEARDALKKFGVDVAYYDKTTTTGADLSVGVAGHDVVTVSSHSSTTKGQLFEVREDGSLESAVVKEKQYTRSLTGLLPRLAVGEERDALVRMGSITVNGKSEERALVLALKVADKKVTEQENEQISNFATAMGVAGVQKANDADGKGKFELQLALTEESIVKLDAQTGPQLRAVLEKSFETIDGRSLPWNDTSQSKRNPHYHNERHQEPPSIRHRWAEAMADLKGGVLSRQDVARDYRATTGRSLYRDLDTKRSFDLMVEALDDTRGKPLEKRGPFLKNLAHMSAAEMRVAFTTLRSIADAKLLDFKYSGNGVTIDVKPELERLDTVKQLTNRELNG